jgi:hypothetical protein
MDLIFRALLKSVFIFLVSFQIFSQTQFTLNSNQSVSNCNAFIIDAGGIGGSGYSNNENYFETIDTEDKAYFLGLIYSDGCLINNQDEYRYKITLKLHTKDKHILEDFIKSVSGEMSLWFHGQRDTCEVSLSGKKIVKDLEEKGLHPNKTFTIKYPEISEELERHFLKQKKMIM